MKMLWIGILIGVVIGALALGLFVYRGAPGMMIVDSRSALGFDDTVQAIQDAALAAGWKVPAVHEISETVAKSGYDVRPASIIELCHPRLAGRILSDNAGYAVTPMMPCRVAVYQNADGETMISRMNTTLMSKLFGGIVEEVMSEASAESEAMFATVTGG